MPLIVPLQWKVHVQAQAQACARLGGGPGPPAAGGGPGSLSPAAPSPSQPQARANSDRNCFHRQMPRPSLQVSDPAGTGVPSRSTVTIPRSTTSRGPAPSSTSRKLRLRRREMGLNRFSNFNVLRVGRSASASAIALAVHALSNHTRRVPPCPKRGAHAIKKRPSQDIWGLVVTQAPKIAGTSE